MYLLYKSRKKSKSPIKNPKTGHGEAKTLRFTNPVKLQNYLHSILDCFSLTKSSIFYFLFSVIVGLLENACLN